MITESQIIKNAEMVESIFKIFPFSRQEGISRMFDKIGSIYFSAPASTRIEYHSAFDGGLAHHSLNVTKYVRKLAESLCPNRWDDSTLCFVGLFHDLGKVGDGELPYYVPKRSDWHNKQGIMYEVNPQCLYAPTSERGLYLLQKFGIEVSHEEWAAIRLNDGQYVEENKPYRQKEPDLALIVHWADMWSTKQEKANP